MRFTIGRLTLQLDALNAWYFEAQGYRRGVTRARLFELHVGPLALGLHVSRDGR